MAKQVMPQAQLVARGTDIKVPDEALFKISLFSQLKRKPSLDKFPGTLVLRHYCKGDVVCRQGEAGWTAFYILTTEDVCELIQAQAELATPDQKPAWQQMLRPHAWNLAQLKAGGNEAELRRAATAHLLMAGSSAPAEPPGLLQRLTQRWRGNGAGGGQAHPVSIPIDGPTDIDAGPHVRRRIVRRKELSLWYAALGHHHRLARLLHAGDAAQHPRTGPQGHRLQGPH